jgi:hypothetical protein
MGFPPQEVFSFYFLLFPSFLLNIIFPTFAMLPQGCVDPLLPGDGQTAPKQAHALANTTKVALEPSKSHK